jgi:hypothetical protein
MRHLRRPGTYEFLVGNRCADTGCRARGRMAWATASSAKILVPLPERAVRGDRRRLPPVTPHRDDLEHQVALRLAEADVPCIAFRTARSSRRPRARSGSSLTFDLDFGEIAALAQRHPATAILFRLHNTRAPHVISRLEACLECFSSGTRTAGHW